MFQLSLVFSHFLVKLFALRRLTQILMLGLILLLMAIMLNKSTQGAKNGEANQKQQLSDYSYVSYMRPKTLISSSGQELST